MSIRPNTGIPIFLASLIALYSLVESTIMIACGNLVISLIPHKFLFNFSYSFLSPTTSFLGNLSNVVLGSLTNAIIEANGGTIIDYVSEDDKKPIKEKTFAKKDKKEVKETKEVTEKEEIKEEKPELDLNILTVAELRDLAKKKEIKGYSKMKKEELIENLK